MSEPLAIKRPVLRYFGGKFILAPWIISHFPKHKVYVEPYGGAASVLMRKQRSYGEVYNDIDDSLYSLFKVLADQKKHQELKKVVEATPFSRREFELAHVYHPCEIEKARRLIVRSFMGFSADSSTNVERKTGFRSNLNRSGTTPAHDWVNWPQYIPTFYERLKGVVIECKDAFDVIKTHDSKDTLFYVDPPYSHQTRRSGRYKHELDDQDHVELLSLLKTVQGNVVLSGYDSEFYSQYLSGWRVVTKDTFADGAKKRTEVLWIKDGEL
jgi:DNA adenine methylase